MYLSPEQLAGGPVTEQADVYSLGMLAYELLSYEPRSAQVGQFATTMQLWSAGREISELRDDVAPTSCSSCPAASPKSPYIGRAPLPRLGRSSPRRSHYPQPHPCQTGP